MKSSSSAGPGALEGTRSNVAAAALLAASGGLLDAVVYLNHGHVFANAMTGNVILLAIAAVTEKNLWSAALHVVPLVAFAIGVALSRVMVHRNPNTALRNALGLEIAGLAVATLLQGEFAARFLVAVVTVAATLQTATFRAIDGTAYNTTFMTGNLRTLIDATVDSMFRHLRPKAGIRLRTMGVISVGFLCGALAGAIAAPRLGYRSFWIADLLLLLAAVLLR